jgi:hypothetical protein
VELGGDIVDAFVPLEWTRDIAVLPGGDLMERDREAVPAAARG